MTIEHPFKQLRRDLKVAQVMAIMLLGIKEIDWGTSNYAFYMGLEQATKQAKSPTRDKMLAMIIAWFKFVEGLIDALPESDYKARVKSEFDNSTTAYVDFLRMK